MRQFIIIPTDQTLTVRVDNQKRETAYTGAGDGVRSIAAVVVTSMVIRVPHLWTFHS